ncbi:hypothetical protein ES332_D03G097500v1 [Gossypium tomentosum]|uniref:Uncharacterized protein n=1 Tax=Gossypium tomentosum TaxID=34277 RepID=A0A5D2LKT1_GOSTO|nr:hypothetical protein ES332_D03G097500v1 [Gossypium tomentosum]
MPRSKDSLSKDSTLFINSLLKFLLFSSLIKLQSVYNSSENNFSGVKKYIYFCIISPKVAKLGGYVKDIFSFPSL